MSEHTKEPWHITVNAMNEIWLHSEHVSFIARVNGPNMKGQSNADARRIVACVNRCAGISTDDLESDNVTIVRRDPIPLTPERDPLETPE